MDVVNSKKIIIALTDDEFKKELSEKLKENFIVIIADTGKEALEKTLQEKPNLVIISDMLPDMTGFLLIEKFREDIWGKNIPIFLIYDAMAEDNIKVLENMDINYKFFPKQITVEILLGNIKEFLKI